MSSQQSIDRTQQSVQVKQPEQTQLLEQPEQSQQLEQPEQSLQTEQTKILEDTKQPEQKKRVELLIVAFIIILGIYIIIPSILINFYNKNNITSTSHEIISYILAIVSIIILFVCIIGSFILIKYSASSFWLRVFIYSCLVIYWLITLYLYIIIKENIDDNNLTGDQKINENFKWLWLVWFITLALPIYIDFKYIQPIKG
jgi:membrane-associated HD superfamily phosphohydrolase